MQPGLDLRFESPTGGGGSGTVAEILAGAFPGMRHSAGRAQRAALDGYLERVIDTDLPEFGASIRRPETLRRWLRAYAAATATTVSYDRIRFRPGRRRTVGWRVLSRAPSITWLTLRWPTRLVGVDGDALLHGSALISVRSLSPWRR